MAQNPEVENKYLVIFTNKEGTEYSAHRPWEFLSARALQRRARYGIPVEETDLPVNPDYLKALEEKGMKLHNHSKWLNAAQIITYDSLLGRIAGLPFVDTIHYVGRHKPNPGGKVKTQLRAGKGDTYDNEYGLGALQISMTNGHVLHQLGFRGRDVLVQVQDGGFTSVNVMPVFDSLRAEGRLFQGRDYVQKDRVVYESSSHGSQVLSVMAANQPWFFVGSAPDATYVLSKTEDTRSESRIEEINWIAAAEYADSLGVDVINSSLGYTTFNDKSLNWTYEELDGNTTWATRGADIAFEKGMIVVNSAGNEGTSDWHYIGSPADGDHVLAVGAVDWEGKKASFSSHGPTADGRIKPNVSAMGEAIVVASTSSNDLTLSAGTSFASPLVAGLVTSLWQAFPERSNAEIVEALENSGHQRENPDTLLGYGIPDMYAAFLELNDRYVVLTERNPRQFSSFSQPIAILPAGLFPQGGKLKVYDARGRVLQSQEVAPRPENRALHVKLKTGAAPPPYLVRFVGY